MRKYIKILILSVFALISINILYINAEVYVPKYTEEAETLKALGIFIGTDKGFELDKSFNRPESAVLFTNFIGKSKQAKSEKIKHDFKDLKSYSWADDYIGYLFKYQYINGIGNNNFGIGDLNANDLATLMLKSLDYIPNKDFIWQNSLTKLRELNIISELDYNEFKNEPFRRDQVVHMCYSVLFSYVKGGKETIIDRLVKNGAITTTQLQNSKISKNLGLESQDQDVEQGTIINDFDEYLNIINKAMKTIQPEVKLIINNFNELESKLDKVEFYGIDKIKYEGTVSNNIARVVVSIVYSQDFKVYTALKNNLAKDRLSSKDRLVLDKANEILKKIINEKMTDYEKELAIHNYIVLNSEYDYDNYIKSDIPEESYTVYGLLINGKGVCEAYSEATKLLLNMVGIECDIVTGTVNSESHAWNIVKLDNEYYMLDTTWNDPYPDEKGRILYTYFNITSDELSQDHYWEKDKWKTANGTKYNYFKYNDMVVNNYDEFKKYIINKIKKGEKEIIVYINGYDKNKFDLSFIFDYYNGSISYSIPKTINTPYYVTLK